MFNAQGEPNVTTNHIADELDISPGNLYYHFRNKEDIVEQVFARYEARMDQALLVPEDRLPNLEDVWLQLHLVFECMWDYRFLYRDLVDILSRNRKLKTHFARILNRAATSAGEVLKGLATAGIVRATPDEIRATAENVLLVATFWLNFNIVRSDARRLEPGRPDPRHLSGDAADRAVPARCRTRAPEHAGAGVSMKSRPARLSRRCAMTITQAGIRARSVRRSAQS